MQGMHHSERVVECMQKKEELEMEKLKKRVFYLHKWSIIRERVRTIIGY